MVALPATGSAHSDSHLPCHKSCHNEKTTLRLAQLLLKAARTPVPDGNLSSEEESDDDLPSSSDASKDLRPDSWTPSSSSSQVLWLAAQAEQCPVPSCWRRLWDDQGRELYVHEHGLYPPQIVHPMLGYFVALMSIVLLAGKQMEDELKEEMKCLKSRVESELAALMAAYSGPLRSELGVDEWFCEATGWFTDVNPSAAPRYFLDVAAHVEAQMFKSPKAIVTSVPTPLRRATLTRGPRRSTLLKPPHTASKRFKATPPSTGTSSTATPGSRDSVSEATSTSTSVSLDVPSSWVEDGCHLPISPPSSGCGMSNVTETASPSGSHCNWYDVASPRSSQKSERSFHSGMDDLEAAYQVDWTQAPAMNRTTPPAGCVYFSLEAENSMEQQGFSRASASRSAGAHRLGASARGYTMHNSEFFEQWNAGYQNGGEDLEADYGCNWCDPSSVHPHGYRSDWYGDCQNQESSAAFFESPSNYPEPPAVEADGESESPALFGAVGFPVQAWLTSDDEVMRRLDFNINAAASFS
jgi:hypothetical protein